MSELALAREHCVLLVIDIQEKLAAAMDPEILASVVRNTNILLEAARRMGIPVVVSEQYPKGLGPTVAGLRSSLDEIDELSRIEKTDFSVCAVDAFADTAAALKGQGRTQWLVTGMETHICVYQSVRALCEAGASVHLPVDAVISRAKHNYRVGLGLAERCGAIVSSTETIVMDLLGCARGEDFKAISKRIR
jgi:nicotinamidase-related amidase